MLFAPPYGLDGPRSRREQRVVRIRRPVYYSRFCSFVNNFFEFFRAIYPEFPKGCIYLDTPYKACHPERRAKPEVEGSSHRFYRKCSAGAKILRLASLAQDDTLQGAVSHRPTEGERRERPACRSPLTSPLNWNGTQAVPYKILFDSQKIPRFRRNGGFPWFRSCRKTVHLQPQPDPTNNGMFTTAVRTV